MTVISYKDFSKYFKAKELNSIQRKRLKDFYKEYVSNGAFQISRDLIQHINNVILRLMNF